MGRICPWTIALWLTILVIVIWVLKQDAHNDVHTDEASYIQNDALIKEKLFKIDQSIYRIDKTGDSLVQVVNQENQPVSGTIYADSINLGINALPITIPPQSEIVFVAPLITGDLFGIYTK